MTPGRMEFVTPRYFFGHMKTLIAYLMLAAAADNSTWVDPATGLIWTASDNRSAVSWRQAVRYCREANIAGQTDWRLPAIEELQGIYRAPDQTNSAFHVKGPIKLSGWQWSATPGTQQGESWAFDFGDGGRASVAGGDSGLNRALCVRSTGKP
jgi:hypothetical protein